jgi:conjugal transfer/entry exclusion protein
VQDVGRDVRGDVQNVGNKVQGVDDKVQGIASEVRGVDDKLDQVNRSLYLNSCSSFRELSQLSREPAQR